MNLTRNSSVRFWALGIARAGYAIVRREQKEKTVPAERAALRFAHRTWPGA
jgi:hypothetical protein